MERRRILHLVTVLLPKGHRDTMEVLFVFLKWVASFSHVDEETGSKMDLQNLSTVICPNILYAKGTDPTKDETFLANRAVSCLLEHQDGFWTVSWAIRKRRFDAQSSFASLLCSLTLLDVHRYRPNSRLCSTIASY